MFLCVGLAIYEYAVDMNLEAIQGQKDRKDGEWVWNCESVFCVSSVHVKEVCDIFDHVNRKICRCVHSIDMYVPHCPVYVHYLMFYLFNNKSKKTIRFVFAIAQLYHFITWILVDVV